MSKKGPELFWRDLKEEGWGGVDWSTKCILKSVIQFCLFPLLSPKDRDFVGRLLGFLGFGTVDPGAPPQVQG